MVMRVGCCLMSIVACAADSYLLKKNIFGTGLFIIQTSPLHVIVRVVPDTRPYLYPVVGRISGFVFRVSG